MCIAEGAYVHQDDRRRVSPDHYFKTAEEMAAHCFRICRKRLRTLWRLHGVAHFVRAFMTPSCRALLTLAAASKRPKKPKPWSLSVRPAKASSNAFKEVTLAAPEEDYWKRLKVELDIINRMGFPGYFLIVSDFIKWSKSEGIPVGPGRGSGAGSVVAWALTITDLDPLRFGLLFERFLNPERVSMPDFDIDFCQDRRDEVIRYVQEKYGRDRVAQIITFGKLQARAVLRDVGRVLNMPFGQVDRICKLVPNNPANPLTLAQALASEPRLKEQQKEDETVAALIEKALRLEGLYRHASTHAAGVVIGDRPLQELVPLYRDPAL